MKFLKKILFSLLLLGVGVMDVCGMEKATKGNKTQNEVKQHNNEEKNKKVSNKKKKRKREILQKEEEVKQHNNGDDKTNNNNRQQSKPMELDSVKEEPIIQEKPITKKQKKEEVQVTTEVIEEAIEIGEVATVVEKQGGLFVGLYDKFNKSVINLPKKVCEKISDVANNHPEIVSRLKVCGKGSLVYGIIINGGTVLLEDAFLSVPLATIWAGATMIPGIPLFAVELYKPGTTKRFVFSLTKNLFNKIRGLFPKASADELHNNIV